MTSGLSTGFAHSINIDAKEENGLNSEKEINQTISMEKKSRRIKIRYLDSQKDQQQTPEKQEQSSQEQNMVNSDDSSSSDEENDVMTMGSSPSSDFNINLFSVSFDETPSDQKIKEKNTYHLLNWTGTDDDEGDALGSDPDKYEIFLDSISVKSGDWNTSGEVISYRVDHLERGSYEIQAKINDTDGDQATDTMILDVIDATAPNITQSQKDLQVGGSEQFTLEWNATDNHPYNYTIYKNGSLKVNKSWSSGTPVTYDDSIPTKGTTYNYTIEFIDESGNSTKDVAFVTVEENPPDVSSPSDFTYEQSTKDNTIDWTLGDAYPDVYNVTNDGSLYTSTTSWTNGTVNINVDGLSVGTYNFTIYVFDTAGNMNSDSVIVTVEDTTAPDVSNPSDFTYEQSTTGHTIDWDLGDINPDVYNVTKDGSDYISTTSWSNGTVNINVDGLSVGIYNFTIYVKDDYGNVGTDSVIVTVQDTTPPDVSSPSNFTYEQSTTGNTIDWTLGDLNPDVYNVTKDGSEYIATTSWTNGTVNINVDGLSVGSYNFTIYVKDDYGNVGTDSVIVTVQDTTPPDVSSPSDFTYEMGNTGHTIDWTLGDLNPSVYNVTKDGSLYNSTTSWTNGTVNINVDGLFVGTYNFTIYVYDTEGNLATGSVIVTVEDTTPPDVSNPSDFTYEMGNTGHTIDWTLGDLNPSVYNVTKDGSLYNSTTSWTNGTVNINVDGLSVGSYNFTIYVYDTEGNLATDSVIITVQDTTPPDVSSPSDFTYEMGNTGHTIDWTLGDLNPDVYNVTKDGSEYIATTSWTNGTVNINVDGLSVGSYNFTIYVKDDYGNVGTDSVIVTVQDTTPPEVSGPSDFEYEDGTNPTIDWTFGDINPGVYNITRNGSIIKSTTNWNLNTTLSYDFENLEPGSYNFTIYVYDDYGNVGIDSVIVTAVDTTSPDFQEVTDDYTYSIGTTGNTIEFVGNDENPFNYSLYHNDNLNISSKSWENEKKEVFNVDGLSVGTHNFTIYLNDTENNFNQITIQVTVVDYPVFVETPTSSQITNTSLSQIVWNASDSNPDAYIVYENGTEIDTGSWNISSAIQVNLTGYSIGTYNFSVYINDTDGNTNNNTHILTITDVPQFETLEDNTTILEKDQLILNWDAIDSRPNNYSIYSNGSVFNTGSWENSSSISLNVSDFTKGTYNITLQIFDLDGNFNTTSLWLTVKDKTNPSLSEEIERTTFQINQINQTLNWNASDRYNHTYDLYRNGTLLVNNSNWNNSDLISYNMTSLDLGTYNFTIIVFDESGNYNTSTVWIDIVDLIAPEVENNPDTQTTENDQLVLSWGANDSLPDIYHIYRNGTNIQTANWTDGTDISLNVSDFTKGTYNITLQIFDEVGNFNTTSLWLTVKDKTNPSLSEEIERTTFQINQINQTLNWNASDRYNHTYDLYRNDLLVVNNSNWNNSDLISYNMTSLDLGTYNFTIIVFDESGNYNTNTILIDIVDLIAPEVENNPDTQTTENDQLVLSWGANDSLPDIYHIYRNGTNIQTANWEVGTDISLDVSDFSKGKYNITLQVFDDADNFNTTSLWLTVIDATIPSISVETDRTTFQINQLNKTLNWETSDRYNDTYDLYRNGTLLVNNTNWNNSDLISYNMTSLGLGTYNFTIIVFDESGNYNTSTIWIDVVDLIAPEIDYNPDVSNVEGTEGNVNFTLRDALPANYTLYINGNLNETGTWNSSDVLTYNVSSYLYGDYNFTLLANDTSGNLNIVTTTLYILDVIHPSVNTSPGNSTFTEAQIVTGAMMEWNASDAYQSQYAIYLNGTAQKLANWNSSKISIDLGNLELKKGIYNLTIVITDTSGNKNNDTVWVTVKDATRPSITSQPSEIENFDLIEPNKTLVWQFGDKYPDQYIIYVNSTLQISGSWNPTTPISFNLTQYGIGEGTYNVTIEAIDQSNNRISNSTIVNIRIIDTQKPVGLDPVDKVTVRATENISGQWVGEYGGISGADVEIQLQSYTNSTNTTSNGIFEVFLNYTNFAIGNYDGSIHLSKYGYVNQTIKFTITVEPLSIRVEISSPRELVTGQPYTVIATAYAKNNSADSSLSLQELRNYNGPVPSVEINFQILVTKIDGSEIDLGGKNKTNGQGDAMYVLSKGETSNINSINTIKANVNDPNYSQINNAEGSLPTITEGESQNALELVYNLVLSSLNAFLSVIIPAVIILAGLIIFFRYRRSKKRQIMRKRKRAEDIIRGIQSIRTVFLQSNSGVSYCTIKVKQLGVDTSLIGGLTSAVSSFMSEVDQSEHKKGFEVMERQGLSVNSHRLDLSNLVIITSDPLPEPMRAGIEEGHSALEEKYEERLYGDTGQQIPPYKVMEVFHKHGLDLALVAELVVTKESMENVSAITRKYRQGGRILVDIFDEGENDPLKLNEILEILTDEYEYKFAEASKIILTAFHNQVLVPVINEGMEIGEKIDALPSDSEADQADLQETSDEDEEYEDFEVVDMDELFDEDEL